MLHCTPFQCKASVFLFGSAYCPTAHTSVEETAHTSLRAVTELWTGGLVTTLHCTPSQCSTRVLKAPPEKWEPTAHTSFEAMAVTAAKEAVPGPGLGGRDLGPQSVPVERKGLRVLGSDRPRVRGGES
jgi:hypothetical protein